jgi:hypothetical protein
MEEKEHDNLFQKARLLLHGLMVLALIYLFWEWGKVMFEQEEFFITISARQNMFAWGAIAIISYLAYRLFGKTMLVFLLLVTAYLLLPERMGCAGENWIRAIENLWFSTDGVFGRPVEVVSRIVLVFIVFGAILQRSGAGEVLLRLSLAVNGRLWGGRGPRGNHGVRTFRFTFRYSHRQCCLNRRVYHPHYQKSGIQAQFCRCRGSGSLHRGPDHAAGDGSGCLFDGGHHRDLLPDHRYCRDPALAHVLRVSIRGVLPGIQETVYKTDPGTRSC